MNPENAAEIREKVFRARTGMAGRAFHAVGDGILALFAAGLFSNTFFDVTGFGIFESLFFFFLVIGLYYYATERAFQRTFCKLFTGSIVVDARGNRPDKWAILTRTLIRFIPLDPFSHRLTKEERWWHDTWSDTYVVNAARLREELHPSRIRVSLPM